MSSSKMFPFQPKLDANECQFLLATAVSSNPFNFVNQKIKGMRIDQVNWIIAHNYGEPKWHLCSPSLSWKGNILGLDIASQNVP